MLTLLACWFLFPLVLAALAVGAGLALEAVTGARLPGPLLVPSGLAVLIVIGGFTTLTRGTAPLTTPVAVGIAVAGLCLRLPRARPGPAPLAAATVAFLAVGAPVLLSGAATFAGYIKLDDTATFLALGDRLLQHGRSLAGLAPSSYEATLESYLAHGYPIGSLVPLAIGHQLTGQDLAWLFQPYLAFLAGMLALALFALLAPLVRSLAWRAGVAALAAQPALLYGYAQWGGVKEMAGAALIPLAAALAARARGARDMIPPAVAVAALLGVLSAGALVWAPLAVVPALWPWRGWRRVLALGTAVVALALPALVAIPGLLDVNAPQTLQSASELGNLLRPLRFVQVLGLWPSGDFRTGASPWGVVLVLLLVAGVAAIGGIWWAWRRRVWGLLAYVASAFAGACVLAAFGSPWAGGKGLAMASPALLCAAFAGCAGLAAARRPAVGIWVAATLGAGVLWSNALAYRDVSLAPRERLAEFELIGERFAGQGPSLMTEYEPYGVRHFLRGLDAEGASELRRRQVPLRDGRLLEKGEYADLDAFQPAAVLAYRTLVLRRSPAEKQAAAGVRARVDGPFMVWQRPAMPASDGVTLPLGDVVQPGAVPRCGAVRSLARAGTLVAAPRERNVVSALGGAVKPSSWRTDESGYVYRPAPDGSSCPSRWRGRAAIGRGWAARCAAGSSCASTGVAWERPSARAPNRGGQYLYLGETALRSGSHVADLRLSVPVLAPGVGGPATGLGPLVLEPLASQPIVSANGDGARALCGRRLDWIAGAAG